MAETFHIGFLLFPNLTQLDFTGPLQVLARLPGARIHLVAKTKGPVETDCGPFLLADTDFTDCPKLDMLCVPGGFGIDQAMQDADTIAFVKRQAEGARYVTSVCTGAFILGAAGLLKGKRATTHWAWHAHLARVGAEPVKARVVRDGHLFTGGGVTAGIDFALTITAEIAGESVARAIQLGIEYDPAPPFDSGSPDVAEPETLKICESRYAGRVAEFEAALAAALG
ncbi:DJ-1/PfpI family protein [Hyphobacterium sp. SN044]|uniref:DJ-1/PfpI family protein n=1 Tax=Hyphobacterium sp. SN044 TaxID=2912575 RepID=UPI001F19A1BD|nr:DJ-1/PfpI family protein [Hyphobacterium sp. SN044]MCF8880976.1 DJ-1/PfpI family protein [Hyphobacterium sp. SN044]